MSDDRLRVLEMIQHKTITAAEGAELLKALDVSEQRMKEGYGENPIPNLLDHFAKARQKLLKIIEE